MLSSLTPSVAVNQPVVTIVVERRTRQKHLYIKGFWIFLDFKHLRNLFWVNDFACSLLIPINIQMHCTVLYGIVWYCILLCCVAHKQAGRQAGSHILAAR